MQTKGELITGRQAKTYDYRGAVWNRIKARHLTLVNPQPGQRVLDVGCGTGRTLQLLSQKCDKGVQLYGLEPSPDMLERARAGLGKRAQIRQGFAQELPYPTAHFDFVISTQVLHHIPLVGKKEMLSEMHRILKPGGTLVLSDWGKPTTTLGKIIGLLWRNHAYVQANRNILTTGFLQTIDLNTHEIVQFGVVHHLVGKKQRE
ncbi:MAG TPA: methyltransferase domain-containing protein [Verrucomicrobiae bacterium]|nr:methyltransferase domain-containing protein [Verrucomicrobiae bacterium]